MLKTEPAALALTALLVVGCDTLDTAPPPSDAAAVAPPSPDAGSLGVALDGGGLDASVPGLDATIADGGGDAGNDDLLVTLRFKGRLGSEELACDRNFSGIGSTRATVKVKDFRFFVSNVALVSASGVDVPLVLADVGNFQTRDVALIDLTDAKGSCASAGTDLNTVITGRVPRGSYTGIKFVTGVPEQLNHADPALAPAPLRAPGLSWDWLQGYRFVVAELAYVSGGDLPDAGATDAGAADAAAPSGGGHMGGGGSRGGVVHVGSTGCLGGAGVAISCTKANRNLVRLSGFDPAASTIVADLAAVFANVDLTQDTLCHGRGEECTPMFTALGVDIATGAALPMQTVFRVE